MVDCTFLIFFNDRLAPLDEERDILRAILRCVVGTFADAQTGQKE